MVDATEVPTTTSPSVEPVSDIFGIGVINTITKAPDYADALPEVKALKVTQWEENSRRLIQEYGQPEQIATMLPKLAARAERERQRALGNDEHGLATLEALGTIRQSVGDDTSLPTQYGIFNNVQKTLVARAQDRIKSAQIKARDESAAASATYAKTVSTLDNIGEALNRKTNSTWEETKAFGNVVGNVASRMFGDVTEAVLTGGGSVIYGSERPAAKPFAYDPKATNKFLTRALIDQSPADLKEMSDRTGLDVSDPKVFNTLADQFKSDFGRNEKAATVVSNGQVLVNPEHAFSQKEWDDAVDATDATPEAKAQAKARRVEIRDQLGRRVHEMIYDIGGYQDFAEAEFKKNPKISDGEMVEKYKESRGGIKKAWTSLKLGVKEGIAGLSQSIYGFAGMVAPKWAGKDWLSQTAMDAGQYAGQQGEIGKAVGNYSPLQSITAGATSVAPYLVAGAAMRVAGAAGAPAAALEASSGAIMTATGFAQSAGSTYAESLAALLASGKPLAEAERLAKMEAVAAGAITAATMKLFPEGAERVGKAAALFTAQRAANVSAGRQVAGGIVSTAATEFGQESLEGLGSGLVGRQFSNPSGTAGKAVEQGIEGGLMGLAVGGAFGAVHAHANAASNRVQANRIMDAAQAQAALAQQAGLPQTAAEIQALAQQAIASFPAGDAVVAASTPTPTVEPTTTTQADTRPYSSAEVNRPANGEPPVPAGMVRLYHGGTPSEGPKWVSPYRSYAEGYARKTSDGVVQFIDVPRDSAFLRPSYEDAGLPDKAPPVHFEASAELMAAAKPLPKPTAPRLTPVPAPTEDLSMAAPTEGDAFASVQKAPTTPAAEPVTPAATSTEVRVGQTITHPTSGKSVVVTEVTPMDDGGTAIDWANPAEGSRGHFVQATAAPVVEPVAAAPVAEPVAPAPVVEPAPAPAAAPAPTVAAAEADIAAAKKASDAASDALFKAQETLADKRATLAAAKSTPSIAAKIQKKVDEQQAKVIKLAAAQQAAENAYRALLGLPEKTTAAGAAKAGEPSALKADIPVVKPATTLSPQEAQQIRDEIAAGNPVVSKALPPSQVRELLLRELTFAHKNNYTTEALKDSLGLIEAQSDLSHKEFVLLLSTVAQESGLQSEFKQLRGYVNEAADRPAYHDALRKTKYGRTYPAAQWAAWIAELTTEADPIMQRIATGQEGGHDRGRLAELWHAIDVMAIHQQGENSRNSDALTTPAALAAPKEPKARKPVVQAVKAVKPVEAPVAPKVEAPKAAEPVAPTPVAPTPAAPAPTAPAKFNPQVGDKVYYQPPEKGKLPVQVEVVAVNGDKITTLSEPQRKYGMAPRVVSLSTLSAEEPATTETKAAAAKPKAKKSETDYSPVTRAVDYAADGIAAAVSAQSPKLLKVKMATWKPQLSVGFPDASPEEIDKKYDEVVAKAFPEDVRAVIHKQLMQGVSSIRAKMGAHAEDAVQQVTLKYLDNLAKHGSPFVTVPSQGKTKNQLHANFSAAEGMHQYAVAEVVKSSGKTSAEADEAAGSPSAPSEAEATSESTPAEESEPPPFSAVPDTDNLSDPDAAPVEQIAPSQEPADTGSDFEFPVTEEAKERAEFVWDTYFMEPVGETLDAITARWGLTPKQAVYAIRRMIDLHMDELARRAGATVRERAALGRFTPDGPPLNVGGARAVELTKHTVNKSTNETTYEHPDFHTFVRDEIFDHFADAYKGSLNRRGQSAVKDGGAASKGQAGAATKVKRSTIADDGGLIEQSFASLRQDEVVTSVGTTLNRIAELQRSGLLSADGAAQRRAAAIQMLPQAARDLVNAAMDRFKLGTTVAEGLVATSKDAATSEPTRLLASALVKANPSLATTPLDIGMHDANEGGAFDPDSGAVSVNPIQHADRIGDTTVHEALHAIGLETVDHYLNEDFDKITPAQKEALDALSTLLESAQQQTLARDGITADTTEHPTLSGEALRAKVYGLTDLGEFINEVLTNEGFRTHLETLQAPEGTSFKGKLKNMWAAVRAALRKLFMGREIEPTSILAQAIDHALAFTQSVSDGSVGTVLDAGGSFVWSIGKLLKDNGRFGAAKSIRADGTMAEKDFEKAIERGNIPLAERDMLRTLVPEAFDKGVVNVRLLEELLPQRKPIVSFTYGMDRNASQNERRLADLTHSWLDTLSPAQQHAVGAQVLGEEPDDETGRLNQKAILRGLDQAKLNEFLELSFIRNGTLDDTTPIATSAYYSVSSIDPAALKAAGGESIKISVALPTTNAAAARARFVKLKTKSLKGVALSPAEQVEMEQAESEAYDSAKRGILHYADALHESGILNTLGWAWLHVVPRTFLETWAPHTLANGGVFEGLATDGKVMLLDEQQSAWAQSRRDALEKSKQADNNEWSREEYKKSVADHPLLDVQHYLVLKQAIAEADKRGITLFAAPDSETAMQTEGHDQYVRSEELKNFGFDGRSETEAQDAARAYAKEVGGIARMTTKGDWVVESQPQVSQAGGMDLHYNITLRSALRNLTGDKGTPAALGVHKNAGVVKQAPYDGYQPEFDTVLYEGPDAGAPDELRRQAYQRTDGVHKAIVTGGVIYYRKAPRNSPDIVTGSPVFKDAQGNPKKDVTVTVYDLRQAQATMHKQGGFTLASKRRSTLSNRVQSKPLDEANSTALRSVWDRLPAHLKQQVKYQPTTEDADFDAAGKWLNENPRTPADQLAVLLGNGNPSLLGLTGREKIAAITLSLTHLIKINAEIDSMNPADVSEDLQQARHELGASISDHMAQFTRLASNTGGDLQAIHMAMKKILGASPEQFIQTAYVAPTEKVQAEKLTDNKDAKAVKASVKKAKATAAVRATDRMTGVFAKLMQRYLGDQAQTTFDFFNDVIGIPASQQARTLEERKAALVDLMADRLATQLRLHGMLNDQTNQNPTEAQQEAMNRMIADVRREVAAQIDRVMASDAGTNTTETPEQRNERLLSQAAAAFGRSDMAAQVFDAAKQRIMALRENSLPEIQKLIDERVAPAQFDPAQIKKFSTAVKQLADFRTMARSSYQSQEKTRAALAEQIAAQAEREGTPLSDAQKAQLRTVLETVFNAEMASAVQDEIAALKKRYLSEKKSPINELDPVRLTRLFAQGSLSDAELYNAIAPAFNLPAYDPALVKTFTEQARHVRGLPPNSVMADDAQTALMKEIGRAHRRQAVGSAKFLYRSHVMDSLWVSGALSGPPTHVVNFTMTAVNVFNDLNNLARGQYQYAVRNGMDKTAARQFFTDAFRAWRLAYTQGPALAELAETGKDKLRSILNSPAILEARAALSTGHTRMSTESSDSIMPLEYYDLAVAPTDEEIKNPTKWAGYLGRRWLALNKYVGRALLAEDSLNRIVARSGAELMYARAALLEDAETGRKRTAEEMKDLMQPFVSPVSADMEDLRATVAKEEAAGHFDHIPASRRDFAKNRRFSELKNRRFDAKVRRDAEEFAAKATFNNDAKGVIGMMLVGGFGTLTNKIPGPWGRVVIPFTRILSNLANAGLDHSPYGWVRAHNKSVSSLLQIVSPDSKYAWQKIEPQSVEYFQAISKATHGTVFLTALATLIGIALHADPDDPFFDITGDGPDDPAVLKQLEQNRDENNNPTFAKNSVKFKAGGKTHWWRHSDFPGVSMGLAAIGAIRDAFHYEKEKLDKQHMGMTAPMLGGLVRSLLGKNMLSGALDFFTAIAKGGEPEGSAAGKRLLGSLVSGYTYPQAIKFVQNATSAPVDIRDQSRTVGGWLIAQTPALPYVGRPAFNILGEPLKGKFYDMSVGRVAPTLGSEGHSIIDPLTDAGINIPVASPFKLKDGTELTKNDSQFYDFSLKYGQTMKSMLTPQVVQQLVNISKAQGKDAANKAISSFAGRAATRAAQMHVYPMLTRPSKP